MKKLIGILNIVLFQFIGIRITEHTQKVIKKADLQSASVMPGNLMSTHFRIDEFDVELHKWFSIQYWVVPLSGWFNIKYRYFNNGPKYFKISKVNIQPYIEPPMHPNCRCDPQSVYLKQKASELAIKTDKEVMEYLKK